MTLGDANTGNVIVTNNLSAANLSGTNTGDQTITLTGDVTGSGTGSFATTIGALKVTNAMLAGSIAASKLVGTDIATVGTITTGTWNGSVVGPAYGGTGVANNAASTLTISGNYATTLTVSGTTGVTLPTTGTLATLAGSETLTNKTISAASNTISSLTNSNLSGTAGITNANLANSSVTVTAGTGLSGGGAVALGSSVSLSLPTVTTGLGGTNITTYTTGDMLYASGTNTLAKRAIGTTGQVLAVAGGVPTWTDTSNVGNWQRNLGAVSPTNITDDVLVGGISTASATFRVDSATGLITTASVNSATIVNGSVANADLVNSSVTVTAGTGMSGGGAVSLGGSVTLTNAGVTSAIGTSNQVNVSAATGGVTFSLPQSIATNSNVTFNNLNLGGSATVSGGLVLYGTPTISTTAKQSLTLGDSSTGNIVTSKNISATGTLTGLTGLTVSSGTVSLPSGEIGNAELANSSVTVTAGTGLSGGGAVSLGSSVSLSLPTVTTGLGGTNITTYTTGDMLYSSATNVLSKLAIGSANQVLSVSGGIPSWVDSGAVGTNYWNVSSGALFPLSSTADLLIGGQSTASAKFAFINVNSGTPTASVSGNLVLDSVGTIQTTKNQTLTIGGNTTGNIDFGDLIIASNGFRLPSGAVSGYVLATDASGNGTWTNLNGDPGAGPWTLTGSVTYPDTATYNVLIGSTTTSDGISPLSVIGFETGKALVTLNETGDQNILVASASGITKFTLDRSGNVAASGTVTGSNLSGTNTGDQTITLSGDISGTGTGAITTTIGALKVTDGMLAGSISNSKLANSSLTVTAGTGMSGGGAVSLGGSVTLTNAGVTSAIGTSNQVNVSGATGAVTFSLPQSIATNSNVTFNNLSLGGSATVSGGLVLYGTPTISTTAKQSLTLGDANTGNVIVTNNLSAANLSGTNTGDQTITLTGDVTGSGTGIFLQPPLEL